MQPNSLGSTVQRPGTATNLWLGISIAIVWEICHYTIDGKPKRYFKLYQIKKKIQIGQVDEHKTSKLTNCRTYGEFKHTHKYIYIHIYIYVCVYSYICYKRKEDAPNLTGNHEIDHTRTEVEKKRIDSWSMVRSIKHMNIAMLCRIIWQGRDFVRYNHMVTSYITRHNQYSSMSRWHSNQCYISHGPQTMKHGYSYV